MASAPGGVSQPRGVGDDSGDVLGTIRPYDGCIYTVSGALAERKDTTDGQHARPPGAYRAYLVRLWQDSAEGPWRAMAREAESGEEHRFATIEQLFLFLHRQTQGREAAGEDGAAGEETLTGPRPP